MSNFQPNNPLHGLTLKPILTHLAERYGWEEPGIKSSLKFLRKTTPGQKQGSNLVFAGAGVEGLNPASLPRCTGPTV